MAGCHLPEALRDERHEGVEEAEDEVEGVDQHSLRAQDLSGVRVLVDAGFARLDIPESQRS